jgi:hypothetical protein
VQEGKFQRMISIIEFLQDDGALRIALPVLNWPTMITGRWHFRRFCWLAALQLAFALAHPSSATV